MYLVWLLQPANRNPKRVKQTYQWFDYFFIHLSTRQPKQAESAYHDATFRQTVAGTFRTDGLRGFYRGFVLPLLGSMLYRGAGFSAYSGAYSACSEIPFLQRDIPFTGGLKPCVLVGAMASAMTRATIESPLDFIKLRYQIGERIHAGSSTQQFARSFLTSPIQNIQHLYHGYSITLLRTMGLLGSFFVLIDYSVRYIPDIVNAPLIGPFFKGGICATAAWSFAFPFETAKSVIQGDTTRRYKNVPGSTWIVLKELYSEGGIKRLYRG